jgi:hypothetical protein
MKKLVLFAVAVVAISFASCGGKTVNVEEEAKRVQDSIEAEAAKAAAELEAAGDSLVQTVDSLAADVEVK